MKSLVSVLIAAYNAGPYIAETLDSVLAQSYPSIEIIVVDDGSTDETSTILDRYAGRGAIRLIRQANAGQCRSRNRAFAESRGSLIKFLDADDLISMITDLRIRRGGG